MKVFKPVIPSMPTCDESMASLSIYDHYNDISDITSSHYDPAWYRNCEIPPDDLWFDIVQDFLWGEYLLKKVKRHGFAAKLNQLRFDIWLSAKMKDRVEIAAGVVALWIDQIEQGISKKRVDLSFLHIFGEFQKNLAIVGFAFPQSEKSKSAGDSGGKAVNKDMYRQWYVLWLKEPDAGSRAQVDRRLEKFCEKVINGKVKEPHGWTQDGFQGFIEAMRKKPTKKLSGEQPVKRPAFKLADTYGGKNLNKITEIAALYAAGLKNPDLPPVGLTNYQS